MTRDVSNNCGLRPLDGKNDEYNDREEHERTETEQGTRRERLGKSRGECMTNNDAPTDNPYTQTPPVLCRDLVDGADFWCIQILVV